MADNFGRAGDRAGPVVTVILIFQERVVSGLTAGGLKG